MNEMYATQASFLDARLQLSASIAKVYFNLKGTLARLSIADSILTQRKEQEKLTFFLTKHGLKSDIPLEIISTKVQESKEFILQLYHQKKLLENQLAILIGDNALQTSIQMPNHFHFEKINLPRVIPANLLAQRPDINAARFRAEAAAKLIKVAKAGFFPDINLIGSFTYNGFFLHDTFGRASQNSFIGVALDLPIFDAGIRRAQLGANYAEYDAAVSEYNERILVALKEVADQVAILLSIKAQLTSQDKLINTLKQQYNLTNYQYKRGIISYDDFLSTQENLLKQQLIQINLLTKQMIAFVEMIRALGGKL